MKHSMACHLGAHATCTHSGGGGCRVLQTWEPLLCSFLSPLSFLPEVIGSLNFMETSSKIVFYFLLDILTSWNQCLQKNIWASLS